jgi:hypothetical protein
MCWPLNLLNFEQVTQRPMDQHERKAALMKNLGWKGRQRLEALDATFRFVRCLLLLLFVLTQLMVL